MTVLQPVEPLAVNLLSGVVTRVIPDGARNIGDEVYSVSGRSVRVVVGSVPFYRDLEVGARGADVAQLEAALVALGYLNAADDNFTATTRSAVRAWQAATGSERTGRVALGELIAVPSLPVELRLSDEIKLGGLLGGGEETVLGRTGARDFQVVLSEDQERLVSVDTIFEVTFEGFTWTARVSSQSVDETGNLVLHLLGEDGAEVCAADCNALPADERTTLRATAIITPITTGLTIPTAAIMTGVDGSSFVRLSTGEEREVTVLVSSGGLAVVDGLEEGLEVVLGAVETG